MRSKNERTQCQLDWTQHDGPVLKLMNDCFRRAEFPHRGIQDRCAGEWNVDHLEVFKGYFAEEARCVDMRIGPNCEDHPTAVPASFQNTMKS